MNEWNGGEGGSGMEWNGRNGMEWNELDNELNSEVKCNEMT